MAATETRRHATWPIVYESRGRTSRGYGTGAAWALFLGVGVPFFLMTILTLLARAGFYVEFLRPLWQPWPPDLWKPLVGVGVFAATLAYLTYRVGHRRGFRVGAGVGLVAGRSRTDTPTVAYAAPRVEAPAVPPPPPDILDEPL